MVLASADKRVSTCSLNRVIFFSVYRIWTVLWREHQENVLVAAYRPTVGYGIVVFIRFRELPLVEYHVMKDAASPTWC